MSEEGTAFLTLLLSEGFLSLCGTHMISLEEGPLAIGQPGLSATVNTLNSRLIQ